MEVDTANRNAITCARADGMEGATITVFIFRIWWKESAGICDLCNDHRHQAQSLFFFLIVEHRAFVLNDENTDDLP